MSHPVVDMLEVVAMARVSRAETVRMLDGVPLFSGLTKRQLDAVAKRVAHESFEPGAVLVKELEPGVRLMVIREGTAEVTRRGVVAGTGAGKGIQQGTKRRIATVGPGDVVGELALIDGKPTSASIIAETPVEALVLYRTEFTQLLKSTPGLYPRLLVAMAERVRAMNQRTDFIG